jgi:hypothetical protein
MPDRRAQLPLNEPAKDAANKKLYTRYPELNGRPLSAINTGDAKYRKFWMDAYLDALPNKQNPIPATAPLQLVLECPKTQKPQCGRSALSYKLQALMNIGYDGSSDQELNPSITRAYADLYRSDPAAFKWAGMAAFASCEVGKGIQQAKDAQSSNRMLLGAGVSGVDPYELAKMLKAGNDIVYNDLAWQHLAYQACGIAEIQKAYDEGQITDDVLQAWRKIDEGKGSDCRPLYWSPPNPELIWEGTEMLLKYEQREVLQKQVYDKDPQMWRNASASPAAWYQAIDSPIPGDDTRFQDYYEFRDASIGNFDRRWKWIKYSMLPKWQKLDATGVDNVLKEMAPCLGNRK